MLTTKEFFEFYQQDVYTLASSTHLTTRREGVLPYVAVLLRLQVVTGKVSEAILECRSDLTDVIGDCLWTVACICSDCGVSLGTIAAGVEKTGNHLGLAAFVSKQEQLPFSFSCAITLEESAAALIEAVDWDTHESRDEETVENLVTDYLMDLEATAMTHRTCIRDCAAASITGVKRKLEEAR